MSGTAEKLTALSRPNRLVIATGNEGKIHEITQALSGLNIKDIRNKNDIPGFKNAPETQTDFEIQAADKALFYATALGEQMSDVGTTWHVSDDSGLSVEFNQDLSDSETLETLRSKGIDLKNYQLPNGTFVDFSNFPLGNGASVDLLAAEDFPGIATGRIARLFSQDGKGEDHEAACAFYKQMHEALNGTSKPILVNFVSAISIAASHASGEKPEIICTFRADQTGLLRSPGKPGKHGFGYDPNFIPLLDNRKMRSYAQMPTEEKAQTSPRALALGKAKAFVEDLSFHEPFAANVAYIAKLRANPDLWDKVNKRWRPNLYPEQFSLVAATNSPVHTRALPSRTVSVTTPHSGREIKDVSPLIAYNGHFNGPRLTTALIERRIMSAISKHVPLEDQIRVLCGPNGHLVWKVIGINEPAKELTVLNKTLNAITAANPDGHLNVMIDASQGHLQKMTNTIAAARKAFGKAITIVAGNATTKEQVEEYVEAGADGAKLNHGPAEICYTHRVAGTHRATLTTTLECAEAAHALGAFVISDGGGLSTSGNAAIQLAVGADFLMSGSIFAGLRECDAKFIKEEDPKTGRETEYMLYSGGASEFSRTSFYNGGTDKQPIEGTTIRKPVKHSGLDAVMQQWHNGLASFASFAGAFNFHDLRGSRIEPTKWRPDFHYS